MDYLNCISKDAGFEESDHPREAKGGKGGGQFAKKPETLAEEDRMDELKKDASVGRETIKDIEKDVDSELDKEGISAYVHETEFDDDGRELVLTVRADSMPNPGHHIGELRAEEEGMYQDNIKDIVGWVLVKKYGARNGEFSVTPHGDGYEFTYVCDFD